MDHDELLRAYDTQLRGEGEVAGADAWDRHGPLWRAVYQGHGLVTYETLTGHDVAALVAAAIAHFRDETEVASFEWKTRGHDDVPGLDDVLRSAGLEPEERETIMVGDAAALAVDVPLRDGLRVGRLDGTADEGALLAEATELQRVVFGRTGDLAGQVAAGGGRVTAWGGFDGDRLVSVGRLQVVADTDFAGLWGGGTLPSHRGLGLYRAMTAARARHAVALGVRLLHSDCTDMSRPILERSGLVAITTSTPYVWTRPAG